MGYPFFIATFPALPAPGSAPAWTEDQFLDEARRNLSGADMAVLEAVASGASCEHPFVRSWRAFETQLRNASARVRAAKLGVDAREWIRPHEGCDGSLDRRVQAAFQNSPDPLSRQRALDALRIEKLSETREDPFGLDVVLAYFLHLRIAADAARPSAEAGRERLRQVVAAVSHP